MFIRVLKFYIYYANRGTGRYPNYEQRVSIVEKYIALRRKNIFRALYFPRFAPTCTYFRTFRINCVYSVSFEMRAKRDRLSFYFLLLARALSFSLHPSPPSFFFYF